MPRARVLVLVLGAALLVAGGCGLLRDEEYLQIIPFEFNHDKEGWEAGFASYPATVSAKSLGLTYEHRLLPRRADADGTALYLAGDNKKKGDSLFMFVKREVGARTQPSTKYRVHMTLKVTSTSPGYLCWNQRVPFDDPIRAFIEAGAFAEKPAVEVEDGYHQFKVGGKPPRQVSGHITHVDTIEHSMRNCGFASFHVLRTFNHNDQIRMRTDEDGEIWAVVGVDTRFGTKTTFYIKSIKVFIRRGWD